jgi:hypothetical protein
MSSYNCPVNASNDNSNTTSLAFDIAFNGNNFSQYYDTSTLYSAAPSGNITDTEPLDMSSHLYHREVVKMQPNTALLSLILTIGTFLIAYFLRIFRNSKFLGRRVRKQGFSCVGFSSQSEVINE